MCGENDARVMSCSEFVGSPPRVRGKQSENIAQKRNMRITPACAGKTVNGFRHLLLPKDHPRVCGENICRGDRERNRTGSPPRVRGKLLEKRRSIAAGGITPACAGKTNK